jgi:hypothetical protein
VVDLIPLLLIGLKLAGVIGLSWWWVLAPIWIGLIPPVLIGVGLLALYLAYRASRWLSRWRFARLRRRSEDWLWHAPPWPGPPYEPGTIPGTDPCARPRPNLREVPSPRPPGT